MCYIIKSKGVEIDTVQEFQRHFKRSPVVSDYALESDLHVYPGSCLCMVNIPESLKGLEYVQDEKNLTIELI